MTEPVTFVSISAALVTIPAAANSDAAPSTHLIGAGLLIATRDGARWRFSQEAATITAGQKEQNLLLWLADRLPMADTLIGWQLDQNLVPALIDAAAHADAVIAHPFMVRLARALRNNVVDLSIGMGTAAGPDSPELAGGAATRPPGTTTELLLGNWGAGRLDAIRHDLAQEALGSWLFFLRQAPMIGLKAEEATRDWMDRRRNVRPVRSAPAQNTQTTQKREIGIRE